MTYLGKMQHGVVVFDGDHKPEDGSVVRIEKVVPAQDADSIGQKLLKFAGVLDGPSDASVNVDHYLYGLPKK